MKKAISCVVFLTLLFFTIFKVYDILSWKDTTGDYLSSTQQLYATDEDLIDVVFVGSSHCYCSIFPEKLWSEYGIAAFDMAVSGQDKDSSYYMLKEVLKTQSPEVVFVEMYGLTFDQHVSEGNVYRNMLAMELSKNSIELVQAYIDEEEQMDYILRWPIVHTRYRELDKYDFVQYEPSLYGRGSNMVWEVGYAEKPEAAVACDEIGELGEKNAEWLEKLYQLSLENNFELVFFVAPFIVDEEGQQVINAAKEYATEREIDFFDFNKLADTVGLDYKTDFCNSFHCNINGGNKITTYIGEYLTQNYYLEDNRGDERYYQWEDAYTYYEQREKRNTLKQIQTIEEYIQCLETMRHITYVVSLEGDYKDSELDLKSAMLSLGMTEDEYEEGGTYLCVDGELTKVLEKDSEEIYIYELNQYDSFKIQNKVLADETATSYEDIMFNMKAVGSVNDGVSFAVYDEFSEEFIHQKGFF